MTKPTNDGSAHEENGALGIVHGFASWEHLFRALVFVLVSAVILYLGALILIEHALDKGVSTVSYSADGGLLIGVEGKQTQISYLPASELWMNSSYVLKPGETVQIIASGKVHLAMDRLFEGARDDLYPKYAWIGPDGNEAVERYVGDVPRDPFLVAEKEPYGRLLMSAVQSKNLPPSKLNPRPEDGIVVIGSNHSYKNNLENPVTLYFAVNDLFLDETAKDAYILTLEKFRRRLEESHHSHIPPSDSDVKKQWEERKQNWNLIVNNKKYWDLWFSDNLGGYTITIIPK